MCLNIDGTRLATASDRGTLFRVFETVSGKKLKEFRRGSSQNIELFNILALITNEYYLGAAQADIQSIAFNKEGTALAVSSNHGTVHVFAIEDDSNKQS